MQKAKRRICGFTAALFAGIAWYCGSCISSGNMCLKFGAIMIFSSIAVFLFACWLGGYYEE